MSIELNYPLFGTYKAMVEPVIFLRGQILNLKKKKVK